MNLLIYYNNGRLFWTIKIYPDDYIMSLYRFDNFTVFRKFCPVEIPLISKIDTANKPGGYKQVKFIFNDSSGFQIQARTHQPIPGSAYFSDGQVWVINRIKSGNPSIQNSKVNEILLNDGTWFKFEDKANPLGSNNWRGLIKRQN